MNLESHCSFASQKATGTGPVIELAHIPLLVRGTESLRMRSQMRKVQILVLVGSYWTFRLAAQCLGGSSSAGHAWPVVELHRGIHRHTCRAGDGG